MAYSSEHTKIPGLPELIFYCSETDNKNELTENVNYTACEKVMNITEKRKKRVEEGTRVTRVGAGE